MKISIVKKIGGVLKSFRKKKKSCWDDDRKLGWWVEKYGNPGTELTSRSTELAREVRNSVPPYA